ncbi:MAG: hypothetical protein IIX18_03505, partial [Clostridia bacterium]|nr:hypothetical protein [Clostridia bacterium]
CQNKNFADFFHLVSSKTFFTNTLYHLQKLPSITKLAILYPANLNLLNKIIFLTIVLYTKKKFYTHLQDETNLFFAEKKQISSLF